MPSLTTFVSISSNRLWALLGLCLIHLCFPLHLDSVLCLTGVLMFKTSLFLSPQVLAIVIRSHIFHMHLVTLLLKDKTTHYFSPGSRSAITTTIYCKNITNNGEVMKYLMVSYVWRITLTPLSVQLLLRPNLHSSVFMKSSLTIPTLSYALISIVHFSNSPWV